VDLLTLWQHEAHTEFLAFQYAYGKSRGRSIPTVFRDLRHRTALPGWAVEGLARWTATRFPAHSARLAWRRVRWVLYEVDQKSAGYLGLVHS